MTIASSADQSGKMIIYLLSLALIVAICFHVSTRYNRFGRLINEIPGLSPLPIFGNTLTFACSADQVWTKLRRLYDEFYPILKVWKIKGAVVLIRHPDDVKAILTCKKNINKATLAYSHIKSIGNDGIIVSDATLWHQRRKILNQAFSPSLLENYAETVLKRVERFVDDLRANGKSTVRNVTDECLKFSLASVCGATMGFKIDSSYELGDVYRHGFAEFSKIISYRLCRPYITDWMIKFLPIGRRQTELQKINEEFINKILNERRSYHESLAKDELNSCSTEDHEEGRRRKLAVLDLLLLAEKKGLIDDRGISSELATIALAGFETTGMQIAFLLLLLAENKEAQDLARTELREIIGDDENITSEHIQQLDYLDRCMKECLRMYPTAPHVGRTITEEIVLSNHKVPVGAELFIGIYDLHRDPNFWPDPEKFDPDRFLPENIADRHPFAYVPFSAGLRNCIGQKLAIIEMKTLVAHIIREFYLEPVDLIADMKFDLKVTLLVDNVRLKFVKIKND